DINIEMPDGVVLLADRFAPKGTEKAPLLLVRSVYGRRKFFPGFLYGRLFAERGFQVLIQSMRGTFGSGGTFDPFGPSDRAEGMATVEWMRRQPWYQGSFGTIGHSYLGLVQWDIASEGTTDLKALAIHSCGTDLEGMFYQGRSFALENMLSWID